MLEPRTAFVLSGGGSLGAVQVGMLHALQARGWQPDLLIGSSAGALNAAFIADGPFTAERVAELELVWTGLRRKDIFALSPLHHALALAGARPSLCSPAGLARLIERHVGYERIEDSIIPLHIVATDVLSGQETVLSSGDAKRAVLASAAVPAVFPPVMIDGRPHFDGGVADNAPISQAVALGAERVVVLPTGYACDRPSAPSTAVGTALHALSLLVQQRLLLDVAAYHDRCELVVLPPLCPLAVPSSDFSRGRQLIDRARRATGEWLDEGRHHTAHPERFLSLHRHDHTATATRPHRSTPTQQEELT